MRNYVIKKKCPMCGIEQEVVVDYADYMNWNNGMLIQRAFPYLSDDEREVLITGICGKCFSTLFNEENEEIN